MRALQAVRIAVMLAAALALAPGCGPGLLIAGGGTTGIILGTQGSGGSKSSSQPPTNLPPAVVISGLVREESPASIEYTILDSNSNDCFIEVEYKLTGESDDEFRPCTPGPGGDGVEDLASSPTGVPHAFKWQYALDTGAAHTGGITVRIRANDGNGWGQWGVLSGLSIGNSAPVIAGLVDPDDTTPQILFSFLLQDQSSDLCKMDVRFSIDQGNQWTQLSAPDFLGSPPVNLLTSPGGFPNQFVWNSAAALPGYEGIVWVELRTSDKPDGYSFTTFGPWIRTPDVTLANQLNTPPELEVIGSFEGQRVVGEMLLPLLLRDVDGDAAFVQVEYSLDGGEFQLATLKDEFAPGIAGPFQLGPDPIQANVVWDLLADLPTDNPSQPQFNGVLKITPVDTQAGQPVFTDAFTILPNTPPSVSDLTTLQYGGNITLVIGIEDESSDPVSAQFWYSIEGAAFEPLQASNFVHGNPANLQSSPNGHENVLTWNTMASIGPNNHTNVRLMVVPTDHPPSGSPTWDKIGAEFISEPFPVINDPLADEPIAIEIFTTDQPGNPTAAPVITILPGGSPVFFDRTLLPPGAAGGYSTFWRTVESGLAYGGFADADGFALPQATGSITFNSMPVPGDWVVLGDGLHNAVTFVFTDGSEVDDGEIPIDISDAVNEEAVALLFAAAVEATPNVRLLAIGNNNIVQLIHHFACNLGNAQSNGGNAADIDSNRAWPLSQLSGGSGANRVRFIPPATAPGGTSYVTIECLVDHPDYFQTVTRTWRLYWGAPPVSVAIFPDSPSVVLGAEEKFEAIVTPLNAPQAVTWEVVGGAAGGSIDATGTYIAPSAMPASDIVTIRARSVDESVVGHATVQLIPLPAKVLVDQGGGGPLTIGPGAGRDFQAQVLPSGAPQGVVWSIVHDGSNYGSGNALVGWIQPSGTSASYVAPPTLPSPTSVQIRATSQVKSTVFGTGTLQLIAPQPSAFELSPSEGATAYAGGASVQFSAHSFVPSNANTNVSWLIEPSYGAIHDGLYTPPANHGFEIDIQVTATSSANPSVTRSVWLTLMPNQEVAPETVIGLPLTARTTAQGPGIPFAPQISPAPAPQGVVWSFPGLELGEMDGNTYMPGTTETDVVLTLRCSSSEDPAVFFDVEVHVTGDGRDWREEPNVLYNRVTHTGIHDPVNNRIWYVGGRSPLSGNGHDTSVFFIDLNEPEEVRLYPNSVTDGLGGSFPISTITAAYAAVNQRLYAIVGQGGAPVIVRYLDLTLVNDPAPPQWQTVPGGFMGNPPTLAGSIRRHSWTDATYLYLLTSVTTLWRTPLELVEWNQSGALNVESGPAAPALTGMTVIDDIPFFVGPAGPGSPGETFLFTLFPAGSFHIWHRFGALGDTPVHALVNPAVAHHNNSLYVFGGSLLGIADLYTDDLYRVDLVGAEPLWTKFDLPNPPPERGDAAMAFDPASGLAYLHGGRTAEGSRGDFWVIDPNVPSAQPLNAVNLKPQGRLNAAGAWLNGRGYIYGGIASHGINDELWSFEYDEAEGALVWTHHPRLGEAPPPLRGASMVADPANGRLILFGGSISTSLQNLFMQNSVHVYDTATGVWSEVGAAGTPPSPRSDAAGVFDPALQRLYVFGGNEGAAGATTPDKVADLWRLDINGTTGTWQMLPADPATQPDERDGSALGLDAAGNRLLMMGGHSISAGSNRQLYQYSLDTNEWAILITGNSGEAESVFLSGAVFDPDAMRFLHAPAVARKAQALVLATPAETWQYLTQPPTGNNATGTTGLFDPVSRRYFYLFGIRQIQGQIIATNSARSVAFE